MGQRLANLVGDELELHQLHEMLVRWVFGVLFEDVDAVLRVLGVAQAGHTAEVVGGAGWSVRGVMSEGK